MRSTAYVSDVVSDCILGLDSKNDNMILRFQCMAHAFKKRHQLLEVDQTKVFFSSGG